MFIYTILLIISLLRSAAAMPFYQVEKLLPRDVGHLAYDEELGHLHAYRSDGAFLGTYNASAPHEKREDAAGACTQLSLEGAKTFGGYQKVEAYANKHWGSESRNIVANPDEPDVRDRTLSACTLTEKTRVQLTEKKTCITNRGEIGSELSGSNGIIKLSFTAGSSYEHSWTVDRQTDFNTGVTVSAGVEVPSLLKAGVEVSTTVSITNSNSKSFTQSNSNKQSYEVWVNSPKNTRCTGYLNTEKCTARGTGRTRYEGRGYIWFNYIDAVKDKTDKSPGAKKHLKWAVNIENVIPRDERSQWLEFSGRIQSTGASSYDVQCKPIKK
ncbi:hypothetical protein BD779DRAFT_1498478 [Infundibulicybe gibba]|nr:hypothetical protein BD779DRAFT_1498478 [Infundibulicybe gibba]